LRDELWNETPFSSPVHVSEVLSLWKQDDNTVRLRPISRAAPRRPRSPRATFFIPTASRPT
jgi:hypothetical protein